MDRKTKRLVSQISLLIIVVLSCLIGVVGIKLYLKRIDEEALSHESRQDTVYVSNNDAVGPEGLYISNVKENLEKFLGKQVPEKVLYKFANEKFYLVLSVSKGEEGLRVGVDKVVDEDQKVSAIVNFNDLETVEYMTGNVNSSTVIRINTASDYSYIAIMEGNHYLLGEDIETISYMNEQFYYLSYNLKYNPLRKAESCSKEVKGEISKFNQNDYYYRYGKINFLSDYYQKLASKSYSVKDRCDELDAILASKEANAEELSDLGE